MRTYYVGIDVHRASIVMVVLNGAGKVVMQAVIETGAERSNSFASRTASGSDRPKIVQSLVIGLVTPFLD